MAGNAVVPGVSFSQWLASASKESSGVAEATSPTVAVTLAWVSVPAQVLSAAFLVTGNINSKSSFSPFVHVPFSIEKVSFNAMFAVNVTSSSGILKVAALLSFWAHSLRIEPVALGSEVPLYV